mgnify:CR=1 FL=1
MLESIPLSQQPAASSQREHMAHGNDNQEACCLWWKWHNRGIYRTHFHRGRGTGPCTYNSQLADRLRPFRNPQRGTNLHNQSTLHIAHANGHGEWRIAVATVLHCASALLHLQLRLRITAVQNSVEDKPKRSRRKHMLTAPRASNSN